VVSYSHKAKEITNIRKEKNMDEFVILGIVILLVIVTLIGVCAWSTFYEASKTEVETYTVGCEVTRIDCGEIAGKNIAYHYSFYKMGVRCDDFSTTLNVTEEDFAKYSDGDIVEVQVTIYEYRDGATVTEYTLLGIQK
jgi:hypothetical protein